MKHTYIHQSFERDENVLWQLRLILQQETSLTDIVCAFVKMENWTGPDWKRQSAKSLNMYKKLEKIETLFHLKMLCLYLLVSFHTIKNLASYNLLKILEVVARRILLRTSVSLATHLLPNQKTKIQALIVI